MQGPVFHHEEILEYIEFMREYIPNAVEVFTNGNCVGFAMMLERKFPGGEVLDNLSHACYRYNKVCYDITGQIVMPQGSRPIEQYGIRKIYQLLKPKYGL